MPCSFNTRFMLLLTITALLCLVLPGEAGAGVRAGAAPWDKHFFISAGPELIAAANAVSKAEKGDVVVLLEEAAFSFDELGRCTTRTRLVYRILTVGGVEGMATMDVGWAPWFEERPEFRARVVTPDGAVHYLSPETISDYPANESTPNMFSDRRIVRAPLPAVTAGAVMEEEIVQREKTPFFAAGSINRFVFGRNSRTLQTRLIIEYPVGIPLRYAVKLLPQASSSASEENGRKRLIFEVGAMEPLQPVEPGMPGDIPRWPNVAFTTGRSWSHVAATYGATVDQQINKSDISALVREIVGDATERGMVIGRLLARLHKEIRYTGIEFGNSSIIPHTPAETLQNKYGDCKDKAALLVRMLRSAGIPAHMALIRAGSGEDVNPDLPGLGHFNHAIVYLPGPAPLWVDPTDSHAPAGELPLYDQGRHALVIGEGITSLTVTPETPSNKNLEVKKREFIVSELGGARANETIWLSGSVGEDYRQAYDGIDDKARREQLGKYAHNAFVADKIGRLEISDPKELGGPFTISLEMHEAQRGYTDDNEALVNINPSIVIERLPAELKGDKNDTPAIRKHDYLLNEPHVFEIQYRIMPPPGFKLHTLPVSGFLSMGPMVFSRKFQEEADGAVTALLRFDTGKRRLTPEEFEAARKAVRQLQNEKPVYVRFERISQKLLAEGKAREALAELRRLAALHPKEALHHIHLANALLELGLGEAARKEAKRAVELEPESSLAHRVLGWVLQHDSIGRLRQQGSDLSRAVAEYRRAKELNPDDYATRGDLAILLEYDEEGERYSRKADMAGAIAEYRAIASDLKRNDLNKNLTVSLFRTERWKDLRELAPALDSPADRNEILLLAIAAEEGASAAVKEAYRSITDPEARQNALATAAVDLFKARHYQEAAELMDEAAKGNANAASIRAKSSFMKRIRRFEQTLPADTGPASVIKKMFLSFFVPESAPDAVISLFAHDIRTDMEKDISHSDKKQRLDFFRELALDESGDLTREVVADVTLSGFKLHSEGSDAAGYRIDGESSDNFKVNSFRVFVVKEEGQYRVAAFNTTPDLIGLEVLRRVDRGDLDGAKNWLDWAREEIPPAKGDDPLSEVPFLLIWPKDSPPDPERMRLAGASLLSELHIKQVIPILLKGRDSVKEEVRRAVDVSLMKAYLSDKKYAEFLEQSTRMEESDPLSPFLFMSRASALKSVNRLEEVRSLAEKRLAKLPKDPFALRVLGRYGEWRGDFEQSAKWWKTLVEDGKANDGDYNELAWLGLFRTADDLAESVKFAERSVAITGGKKNAYLHTLAALYAETGKTAEAREIILKSIAANKKKVPNPQDWYVLGRIAENYGESEEADEAYAKVTKHDAEGDLISTYVLAQKRLQRSKKQ